MKLAVICNNKVALPTIQFLRESGFLHTIGVPAVNKELCSILGPFSQQAGVALKFFQKEQFEQDLNTWVVDNKPDAVLMMTWPFKIPASVLGILKYGFINFHYGLLPRYRGVNPVFEQIKRREKNGGITVHHVDEDIDNGAVILKQPIPIVPGESFAMHMDKLSYANVEVTKKLLDMMVAGHDLPAFPQDDTEAMYYKRPALTDVVIKWNEMEAEDIIALANACNPWNYGAAAIINNTTIGILDAFTYVIEHSQIPGTIHEINEEGMSICCKNNKVLRVPMVYTTGGFIRPIHLMKYGLNKGNRFS